MFPRPPGWLRYLNQSTMDFSRTTVTREGEYIGDIEPGHSRVMNEPCRRDTMSTISSEKPSPLPTGFWRITMHGNCPRCHHHHKSVMVPFKISSEPTETHSVYCERCGQKWFTVGGLNTTQISLLSTKTTDLDPEEVNFRDTLFSIVRSAMAVASPTSLTSVPEAPPRLPSGGNSEPSTAREVTAYTRPPAKITQQEQPTRPCTSQADSSFPVLGEDDSKHEVGSPGHVLRRLRRRLKKAFPAFRETFVRDVLRIPGQSKPATAVGKQSATPQRETDSTPARETDDGITRKEPDDLVHITPLPRWIEQ